MPVIAIDRQQFPAWCELEHFDIIALDPGETHTFDHHGVKEKMIIGRGVCSVRFGDGNQRRRQPPIRRDDFRRN